MHRFATLSIATLSIATTSLFAACGSPVQDLDEPEVDGGTEPDVDGGVDENDFVRPTVVSVTPPNGATGVDEISDIVIEFSEPMDQASVLNGFQAEHIDKDASAFVWNTAGDTLTIVPSAPLPIAEGLGLNPNVISAQEIAYAVEDVASDLAGNSLPENLHVAFTTPKRMTAALTPINDLIRVVRADGLVFNVAGILLPAGDSTGNLQTKVFASFDTPTLPANAVVESATLIGNQSSTLGNPYSFGELRAMHINAAVIDDNIFNGALAFAGDFSINADVGRKELDVTPEFLGDLANRDVRGDRTQFRLEFPVATNNNGTRDEARFSRSGWEMDVVYRVD